jgi:hypothetical protein
VLLSVGWDNDDLQGTYISLGCPADSPTACKGRASLAVRGGRRLFSGGYRIAPGRFGGPEDYFEEDVNYALIRRGARVTLRGRDTTGRTRTLSRVLGVVYSPGGPD